MTKYAVTTNERLREICIKNKWFVNGTNAQYDKFFRANEYLASIEEMATIIWLCTEGSRRADILRVLKEERVKYWCPFFNVEDPKAIYRVWDKDGIIYEWVFENIIDCFCDPNSDVRIDDIAFIYTLDEETVYVA